MSNNQIVFRVDATKKIGMGHMSRCIAIASYLKSKIPEKKIIFISFVDSTSKALLKKNNISFVSLRYLKNTQEIAKKLNTIKPYIIINDIWANTSQTYLKLLKKYSEYLIVLDDFHWGKKYADILINSLPSTYIKPPTDMDIKFYQGLDYLIIPNRITAISNKNIKDILIIFGGTDSRNSALEVAEHLHAFLPNKLISVISSEKTRSTQLFVHKPFTQEIGQLIAKHKIIVTSGGITMFEALKARKQVFAYASQPWERKNIAYLEKYGAVHYIGSYLHKPKTIAKTLTYFLTSPNYKRTNYKQPIDGRGLERVVNIIQSL